MYVSTLCPLGLLYGLRTNSDISLYIVTGLVLITETECSLRGADCVLFPVNLL